MDQKSIFKLELDKVLARLEGLCGSPLGAERARHLRPATDLTKVQRLQAETSEAASLLCRYPEVSLEGASDVRNEVERARAGAVLDGLDLKRVAATLAVARRLKKFFAGREGSYPILTALAGSLGDFDEIIREMDRALGPEGEVLDAASLKLAAIRRNIRSTQEAIKAKLENYLRSAEMQKYLQDNLYTVRGDRYVLPVKQEYRHQVPGLVHDQSASGATLFIEPMPLVELNNELRRLLAAEKQEVEAVLRRLTSLIASRAGAIQDTLALLANMDFILAKGRLSLEMRASPPILNIEGRWLLRAARHPLLKGAVVPVDIRLGEDFDTLVITGPNTGGKTVTLKTLGLLTLMAQCGLHIPAGEGSVISVCRQIFADIGDEQSIEQSLSTFSSHMTHIISILRQAGPGSLVLLDELGAGTDPTQGAALAMAILERLRRLKARTVATTHYSELKAYAYATPRVENAAVDFDPETLQPTFRLVIGAPGESNAFEIAARLGLPGEVVARARSFLSEEEVRVADMIRALAEDRRVEAEARQEAERLRQEAQSLLAQLEREREEWRQKMRAYMEKARAEASQILRQARREVKEVVSRLEAELQAGAAKYKERALQEARDKLQAIEEEIEGKIAGYIPAPEGRPPATIKPGEWVFVPRLQQKARVLTAPNAQGEVQIQVGAVKFTLKLEEIRALGQAGPVKEEGKTQTPKLQGGWAVSVDVAQQVSPEIDLRGLTVEEARQRVDKYLDDAVLAGLNRVVLIHGKGTGALRSALRDYLQEHPLVKSFRLGREGEGDLGVTVVEI
ncbi:MAG: mismatch repair protein MutS2 [Clostridia bacterium]|nr:mismatch repair protein MutS2 [Clostridia bacterium]